MLTTRVHYLIVLKKSMHYRVLESMHCIFYLTHFCVSNPQTYTMQGNWHSKQSLWTVFLFHNLKISASICCKKKKKSVNRIHLIKEFLSIIKRGKTHKFMILCYLFHFPFAAYTVFMLSNCNNSLTF